MTSISLKTLKTAARDGLATRLVPNLSFAFNFYFHQHDLWGYHVFNIATHISAAISFYFLSLITLNLQKISYNKERAAIALAASLLWAAHPLQTNATTYIVQRMTSMAALFTFLSIIFYIKGRTTARLPAKLVFFFSCFLAAVLAFFSKENSAILPLIFLMYEVYFLAPNHHRFFTRIRVARLIAACLAIFALTWHYSNGNLYDFYEALLNKYELRDFTLYERLLTQTRVLFLYLSLLALPLPGRLNLSHDFAISTGFFSPPVTFMSILALGGLIFLGFYLYKRQKLISFGVFWLIVTLLIESSVIPLELVFEHRMYFPSSMLILSIVAFISNYHAKKPATILLIFIVTMLSVATWQRNKVWSNGISLWSDVVAKSPNIVRGYLGLGNSYLEIGLPQKADEVFLEANRRKLEPAYFNNWGRAAFDLGQRLQSMEHSTEAKEHYMKAIGYFKEAIRENPNQPQSHYNLGIAYGSVGLKQKARWEMSIGMSLGSRSSVPLKSK